MLNNKVGEVGSCDEHQVEQEFKFCNHEVPKQSNQDSTMESRILDINTHCNDNSITTEFGIYEDNLHVMEAEIGLVGSGIGGGFLTTNELHIMKYSEAMAGPDCDKWQAAIRDEYMRMINNKVFTVLKTLELPLQAKILTSTWAMKKKANGQYLA